MLRFKLLPIVLAGLLALGFAYAQIGEDPSTILTELADRGLAPVDDGWYGVAEGFQVRVVERGGLVFRVEGRGPLTDVNTGLAAEVIGVASGLGAQVEEPVARFFDERKAEFVGQGRVAVGLDAFVLSLDVTGDAPYEVDFSLAYAQLDPASFPETTHVQGPADATYVIREFSDFQCPFCARYALETLPVLKGALLERGDVRFEYHHFPLQSIHPNAAPAAEASECVASVAGPDAFWDYHDALFEQQSTWAQLGEPIPYFVDLAVELGFTSDDLATCIQERRFADAVAEDFEIAASTLRLRGTPTVFVNGFRLGDFRDLQSYLDLFDRIDAFSQEESAF